MATTYDARKADASTCLFSRQNSLRGCWQAIAATWSKNKKTDVAEHQQVFDHVGLLANEPLGTAGLLSI
jgi:hypothetical protein